MSGYAKYVTGSHVQRLYDVGQSTLRTWANNGQVAVIRHPNGKKKRLYLLSDIERRLGATEAKEKEAGKRIRVIYGRVSSTKQSEDLKRQVADLRSKYPDHQVITDIGSGLNFNRKGFQAILQRTLKGDIEEVVVMHRDRLCRFALDLMESIFKASNTRFVVLGGDQHHTPQEELAEDMLAITTVFVAKGNGIRSAEHRKRRKEEATHQETKNGETGSRKVPKLDPEAQPRTEGATV